MSESFREQNRRRREAAAFANLYRYARDTGTPDPKRTAERTARRLHRSETPAGRHGAAATAPTDDLEERTRDELYARAQELDIEGRSQMNKAELVEALRSS
jgi:hypothetical protein